MLTYNHELYIRQAIEGVLVQKCNFIIELVIGEDCSTDKTRAICEEYGKKYSWIKLLKFQRNLGPSPNFIRTLNACTGKYIALCEGDDYWTDQYKLQKQVNFLENNPDYGLVHTDVNQLYNQTGLLINNFNKQRKNNIPVGDIFEFLLKPDLYIIKTPSVLFRKELFYKYVDYDALKEKGISFIDLCIWLELSKHSKIGYIAETTAVYRVLKDSLSNFSNVEKAFDFSQEIFGIRSYYISKYGCSIETKKHFEKERIRRRFFYACRLSNKNLARQEIQEYFSNFPSFTIREGVQIIFYYFGARFMSFKKIMNTMRVLK
jgi:glycosyltransferase involved in cell wall biosynthesis